MCMKVLKLKETNIVVTTYSPEVAFLAQETSGESIRVRERGKREKEKRISNTDSKGSEK